MFWLYAALAMLGILFFAARVPETRHRTPEQIERDLARARQWFSPLPHGQEP